MNISELVTIGITTLTDRSIYSFAVYFGSSIYVGAVPEVVQRFGVSIEVASLALCLYVFGCKWRPSFPRMLDS